MFQNHFVSTLKLVILSIALTAGSLVLSEAGKKQESTGKHNNPKITTVVITYPKSLHPILYCEATNFNLKNQTKNIRSFNIPEGGKIKFANGITVTIHGNILLKTNAE